MRCLVASVTIEVSGISSQVMMVNAADTQTVDYSDSGD
jgi:hypothetical protein